MSYDEKANNLAREASAAKHLLAELGDEDADINHDLIEGETSLLEAIDAAIFEISECDVIIDGCLSVEKQIAARRSKAQERSKRLRGLIEQAMLVSGLQTAKLPTATLSVRSLNPKPVVTDEALVPAEYWKQPDPVLDKSKISKAAELIPGITMSNGGTSLQIRRL